MSGPIDSSNTETIILHLIVVGFHHKKGCLVEYCYPPLRHAGDGQHTGTITADTTIPTTVVTDSETIVLPHQWKTLPSLALPDGSHNHERDAIYFHLPDFMDQNRTVFGVSCYRQINANILKSKSSDITRGSVQKSVVILSRLPLYGLIEAKLEMITHAYFRELDFSKIGLLEETYHNLNAQLDTGLMQSPELYVGLTPRQLVIDFHHKIVVLFKLLLLERKVLFYKSPVKPLCVAILSLCSLMPGLISKGLTNCSVSVQPKQNRQSSADVELVNNTSDEFLELTTNSPLKRNINVNNIAGASTVSVVASNECDSTVISEPVANVIEKCSDINNSYDILQHQQQSMVTDMDDSDDELLKEIDKALSDKSSSNKSSPAKDEHREANKSQSIFYDLEEPKPERVDKIDESSKPIERMETPPILKLSDTDCGLPLEIFSCGSYLLPYLSLTYLDVLTDVRIRSCLIGATNFLFKQKRDIFDVIVELDGAKVEILDPDLRKQLTLTTEDLRFADFLVKTVLNDCDNNGENSDIFIEGTGWEGSDEWIRYQFKIYLLHLLRSSEMDENSKDYTSFNSNFLSAWRSTHNYKIWSSVSHSAVFEVPSGHPFGGQLSVNDMKLRLSQIFYSKTEQNKRLNQTVQRTSRAMGGAVTSAKTAISSAVNSFWSNWSQTKTNNTDSASDSIGNSGSDQQNNSKRPEAETQL